VCWTVHVDRRDVPIVATTGFDDLYRREAVSLATLATAMTGSREVGADLAHEALLRAYRDWTVVSTLDRPGAWVRRVVINLATDVRRRGGREQRALGRVQARAGALAVVDSPTVVDDPFWIAVRSLPDRQRAAVVLHYVDDLSIEAIAEVMDVSTGTVKASLFAARKSLAERLGADDGGSV
jgi:RNA polymerase sigma-70 factor, ECF subfamily